jgi:hypothetical protein
MIRNKLNKIVSEEKSLQKIEYLDKRSNVLFQEPISDANEALFPARLCEEQPVRFL